MYLVALWKLWALCKTITDLGVNFKQESPLGSNSSYNLTVWLKLGVWTSTSIHACTPVQHRLNTKSNAQTMLGTLPIAGTW